MKLNKDLLAIFPQDDPAVQTMHQIRHNFEHGGRLLVQLRVSNPDKLSENADDLANFIEQQKLQEQLSLTFDPLEMTKLSRDPLGLLNHPAIPDAEGNNPFISNDGLTQLLILYPQHSDDSSGEWCGKIESILNEWEVLNPNTKLSFTGSPAFSHEIAQNIKKDVIVTIIISSIFSSLIFWLLVKHHRLIHLQISLVASILLITYGIGALLFESMSLMSVGFASILIGLSVDYAMVICTEAKRSDSTQKLFKSCLRPILFASLSTASVFAALALSELPGVQELGVLIAIGILIAAYILLAYFTPFATQFAIREHSKKLAKKTRAYPQKTKFGIIC